MVSATCPNDRHDLCDEMDQRTPHHCDCPCHNLRSHDMYGNQIYPLGETGYGVSMSFWKPGMDNVAPWRPEFTFFHRSDGFRQCLFSARIEDPQNHQWGWSAGIINEFADRIAEIMATRPHG